MADPTGPTLDDFTRALRASFARMREQFEAAGFRLPTSTRVDAERAEIDLETLAAPLRNVRPVMCTCSSTIPDAMGPLHATDCPMYRPRLRLPPEEEEIVDQYRRPAEAGSPEPAEFRAAMILAELRGEAEAFLGGVTGDESDRSVVIAALRVLAKVQSLVIRELGSDWQRTVRPFGARTGWGEDAGQPLTVADAVEYIAADRAQWRKEAAAARTSASEAVEQARAASSRARDALTQVQEIRRLLGDALRPNAHAADECDLCTDGTYGDWPCEDHNGLSLEPALSADLADEVRRVITLWHEARAATRAAKRGRVSVYVDGDLVTGPDVIPDVSPPPVPLPTTGTGKSAGVAETIAALSPYATITTITGKAPQPEPVDAHRWWVAVGSLADYAEAAPAYAADYEVRVEPGLPARVRDLRAGPPPDLAEAAIYCGATCGEDDTGRMFACVMLDQHMGPHIARDEQGRYRAFSIQALAFAPLGTGQWADHDRLTYRDEEYVVLRGMFGAVDGRHTLLYPDGSRRVVQLDPPPAPGPGEVVNV